MQEQGISLDETDKCGNSAVNIASQHGYLGCIQVTKSILLILLLGIDERCILAESLQADLCVIQSL